MDNFFFSGEFGILWESNEKESFRFKKDEEKKNK